MIHVFRTIAILVMLVATIWVVSMDVYANYVYERDIHSFWALAEKSSTIPAKATYVDSFVRAYKASHASGYNALILKTPNQSIDANLAAVETLQHRLDEVQGMDVTSFAYQTAIQQITEQEQGEASNLLAVLKGGWFLCNYWYLWDWLLVLVALALFAGWAATITMFTF